MMTIVFCALHHVHVIHIVIKLEVFRPCSEGEYVSLSPPSVHLPNMNISAVFIEEHCSHDTKCSQEDVANDSMTK